MLRLALPLLACVLTLVLPAKSQEFTRPVRIVMGFGAGGLADISGRVIAEAMSKSIGQPVIIENMPGAGATNAALSVARAAPDGHTMLWVSGQNAIAPSMFKALPYDWSRDFSPIGPIATFDFVLFVAKDSPLKSVQDVIEAAKKNPEKFNLGTISVGSAQYLAARMFVSMTGLDVPTIPFRTTGEVVTGLLSGNVQAAFETIPGIIGQINGGSLRAIAVSSKRVPFWPEVPTISEAGVSGYLAYSWNGMVLPAKTPKDVVTRLNDEMNKAIAAPEVQKRFHELLLQPRTGAPQDLQKIYDDDVVRWRRVLTDAKIEPN